ncbi:MAG: aminodeoxychorismate synthase component I [Epsilonproteobacteria bacterium]|nr:aminodeoxychorismate synthase component I [Campylobacterota bacterium]
MTNLKEKLNHYGQKREPIFFVIDFEAKEHYLSPLNMLEEDIVFSFQESTHCYENKKVPYTYHPIPYPKYEIAFKAIQEEIKKGNTYLINLTFPSKLEIPYNLKEIYDYTDARFKLYFKDQFVCFTPERFVKIENDSIYTYPMKGTIEASIPNAEAKILNDQKEMAEHVMVVDLLRNDLSMISKRVRVEKFRYIEKIKAGERELLQVSSKIKGELELGWQDRLGEIITTMLPAGSITGAPKKSTTQIIKDIEGYERGFFSGVFGIFDGEKLDSAVMIRFIEKTHEGYLYKSGGGITIDSQCENEYLEMCEKVYVPFF